MKVIKDGKSPEKELLYFNCWNCGCKFIAKREECDMSEGQYCETEYTHPCGCCETEVLGRKITDNIKKKILHDYCNCSDGNCISIDCELYDMCNSHNVDIRFADTETINKMFEIFSKEV